MDALIADYYRSEAFTKALSPATQRMRRNIIERFRAVNGGNQVMGLRRETSKSKSKAGRRLSKELAQDSARTDAVCGRRELSRR